MIEYAVLALATLTTVSLGAAIWVKTRQLGFIFGLAVLYYWSLYGGWLVVNRGHGYGRSYRFEYLFYKLFPIYLDEYYLWTLILYTLFIVTVQVALLCFARRRLSAEDGPDVPILLSHVKLLIGATCLAAGAYIIVWDVISQTIGTETSGYSLLRQSPRRLFSLYQIFHQSALVLVMMGLAVLVSGSQARYMRGVATPLTVAGYGAVMAAILTLNVELGNRSMIIYAFVGGALFYLANTPRPSKTVLAGALCAAAIGLAMIGIIRGAGAMRELKGEDLIGKAQYIATEILSQDTEAFAAHASMYGALQKHVPLTYGSSVLWLATSLIPNVIRPNLVPIIYDHYATHVGASFDQGFTVHHATGWYLNFGVLGVIAGALLLGWIWAQLFNNFCAIRGDRSLIWQVFATVGFWSFTAYIPMIVRSGPETYKGALVETLLIPTLFMTAISLNIVKRANRPRLVPAHRVAHLAGRVSD